ncbi:MAG: uncharacterized protein A8A55_1579 [Amphiamblys sp. WSBS2006]|nr:MAG: uncharacterized protein A8A55_1579 [Amphiamblys sp. WSBS2006]
MSYFDAEDILAGETMVGVVLRTAKKRQTEVPLWSLRVLLQERRIDVRREDILERDVEGCLDADPGCVVLSGRRRFFFRAQSVLLEMFFDEKRQRILRNALCQRAAAVVSEGQYLALTGETPTSRELFGRLDLAERKLFLLALEGFKDSFFWERSL